MTSQEAIDAFKKYGLFSKVKHDKDGNRVGLRIYPKGNKHLFFDWLPGDGILSRFYSSNRVQEWQKVGQYKTIDEVANQIR